MKKVRYAQRLIPVSLTDAATETGLERLATTVLKPVFHQEGQQGYKFAIRTEIRNHHVLNRDTIIPKVAEIVGRDHGHKVDLKGYDKLIIVNCYKNSLGIAVVDGDFEGLKRFNLQQIFEQAVKEEGDGVSRVRGE